MSIFLHQAAENFLEGIKPSKEFCDRTQTVSVIEIFVIVKSNLFFAWKLVEWRLLIGGSRSKGSKSTFGIKEKLQAHLHNDP